jgi:beta-lactamase class A
MIAYVARELDTGRTLSAHPDVPLPSYSTIKVLLAAAFWRMVARGELDEAEEYCFQPGACVGGSGVLQGFRFPATVCLADLVHLTLVVSDNDAANVVACMVGFERVNALADELGMTATRMQRLMMDAEAAKAGRDNLTSAGDLARLLEALTDGSLEPPVGECVLASLALQEHLDGIARYLPAGVSYLGKCGDDSPEGRFAHDCALVRRDGRDTVVVVMTRDSGGFETVARTGAALYAALDERPV